MRDIVTALADQIRDTLDDTLTDIQVEPTFVLNPTPPTVDVYPGDPERDRESAAFGDVDGAYLLTVRARIGTADFDAGYDLLLSLMDDEDSLSLAQAVLDDPTLGGWTTDVDVFDHTGLRAYEHPSGEGAHLGFQFTVKALAALS